jgi:hypothetical protein
MRSGENRSVSCESGVSGIMKSLGRINLLSELLEGLGVRICLALYLTPESPESGCRIAPDTATMQYSI